MPVFVSTTFMPIQSSSIDAAGLLKKHNILNIELGSIHRPEANLGIGLNNLGCNYITHNFFPPDKDRFILNIASKDEGIRKKSVNFIKKAIDFAITIGADIYTFHPGYLAEPLMESRSLDNFDFNFSPKDTEAVSMEYDKFYSIFLRSLKEVSRYIENKPIKIAIESGGSVSKKDVAFFAQPQDFLKLFKEGLSDKIGINLNLGHLNLAANAWGFDKAEAIETLKPKITAVEVSHNDGLQDEHRALIPGNWYMDILNDGYFKAIPIIFEGRNLAINDVIHSYGMLNEILA